jgi:peptide/nickel transport system permease protein
LKAAGGRRRRRAGLFVFVYSLQRLLVLAATLVFASLVVFGVLEILPGNAAMTLLGASATPEAVAALAHKLGLDQPFAVRYGAWVAGALRGDFGVSYAYDSPIGPLIAERLAVSAPLALLSMLIAAAVALAAGVYAVERRGRLGDAAVMAATQVGLAVPNFWFGILLVLVFAVHWRLAPAGGFPGWEAGPARALGALILPAIALGLVQAAILTRVTRSALIEALGEDFIRTARAKGLSRRAALWRHALPNAMTPILTIMGLQFANLVAGAIVVENVFVLPGLGRLIVQSIANRDTLVVEDCVTLLAAFVIGLNFLVDLACAAIDPRLRARAP